MTRFSVTATPDKNSVLVVPVLKEGKNSAWPRTAERFPKELLELAREDGFTGDVGGHLLVRPKNAKPAPRLLLLGGGPAKEFDLQILRKIAGQASQWAGQAESRVVNFLLPGNLGGAVAEAQAVVEGFTLGGYKFLKHKSKAEKSFAPSEIRLVAAGAAAGAVNEALRRGEIFASAVNFARDLINEPPSLKVPERLGRIAQKLSGKGVRVRVYRKGELKSMRMEALLGVNRGSAHPPVLVHFHYKPAVRAKKRVAFVGKGITFDSGGLSLKPADGMMTMKYDMAGAANVFGLFHALSRLRPDVEVHGVTPITENMPGQDAYKPGDVVRAANGKTIEVLNTDAEGRVVLADALSFTSKLAVDEIIDMATLTGAATIALGKAYVALMTNNAPLANRLRAASEKAGEKLWELPLEAGYKEHIKSKVADLKNIGNPGEAGTIIGGLFLQEFVAGKPWVHLDIASAGWNPNGGVLGAPGATGVMIRTLLHYILN